MTKRSKPKGLMFRPEMVRALLAGTKTQTRRIISNVAGIGPVTEFQPTTTEGYDWIMRDSRMLWNDFRTADLIARAPHPVGSKIWVKETWGLHRYHDFTDWNTESVSGQSEDEVRTLWDLAYLADMNGTEDCHWRSSMFMPRWASRITLEVTDVRVQRLQEISEEDAKAEGAQREFLSDPQNTNDWGSYRAAYRLLWESINGPGSWDANPYVWAYMFTRRK